jgi:membrane-associated phospholipid phosphatase
MAIADKLMIHPSTQNLENALGDEWYRCCWLLRIPGWLTAIGSAIAVYFEPVLMSGALEAAIVLNLVLQPERWSELDVFLCRLHNLLIVPTDLLIGLYLVFRQPRPGRIRTSDGYRPFGSIYGMPSGDSLFGALIGTTVFPRNPIFGVIVLFSVAASRVVRGVHSILQVTVGLLFGIAFALLSQWKPIEMQLLFWGGSLLLPGLMYFDLTVIEDAKFGGPNNLFLWYLFGVSTVVFDIVVCAPDQVLGWMKFDRSHRQGQMVVGLVIRFVLHWRVGQLMLRPSSRKQHR